MKNLRTSSTASSKTTSQQDAQADLKVIYVPIDEVVPNTWNPNRQDDFIYEKERASIQRFGFIDPILVRDVRPYEIIDGEHRHRAARDEGYRVVPILILDVTEDEAKQLTIILNETRGRAQPDLLRKLLADLASRRPVEDLLRVLPYTPQQFEGLLGSFDWGTVERSGRTAEIYPRSSEKWVLLSWRVPADVAEVVNDAIRKVQSEASCPDWQALEAICADFLAG